MSNPKILLPLIAIIVLACICVAGQMAFDQQKQQQQEVTSLLNTAQTQASAIDKLASAIDTMAKDLDLTIKSQQRTIDEQQATIKAQTWYVIIIGAIALVLLIAYIGSKKGR